MSFLFNLLLSAQKKNGNYQLHIHKASSNIEVDGVVDELAWKEADIAKDFFMVLPMDTSHANVKTEVRMSYDAENIYLLAVCFHKEQQKYMVESLKRDFSFGKNDNFLLFMDPFDDSTIYFCCSL